MAIADVLVGLGRYLRLKHGLLGEELVLTDQKREEANAIVLEFVVKISQPLVLDLAKVLSLVDKKRDPVVAELVGDLAKLVNQAAAQCVLLPGGFRRMLERQLRLVAPQRGVPVVAPAQRLARRAGGPFRQPDRQLGRSFRSVDACARSMTKGAFCLAGRRCRAGLVMPASAASAGERRIGRRRANGGRPAGQGTSGANCFANG